MKFYTHMHLDKTWNKRVNLYNPVNTPGRSKMLSTKFQWKVENSNLLRSLRLIFNAERF